MQSECSSEKKTQNGVDKLRLQVCEFLDYTSTHGVPHVKRVRPAAGKLFWAGMSLGMFAAMVYNVISVTILYSKKEYSVMTDVNFDRNVLFPAVTVCNINPLRKTKLAELAHNDFQYRGLVNSHFTEPGHKPLIERLRYHVASMSDDSKKEIGHQLDTMLLSCQYQTYTCSIRNFTWFFSYFYGNCFKFIPDPVEDYLVSRAGAFHALTLDLFLETEEQVFDLAPDVGFRLLVHDRESMAFPDEDGLSISPGFQTEIGVKKRELTRLGRPYYACEDVSRESLFSKGLPNSFTRAICYRTCYQTRLAEKCHCYDATYPAPGANLSVCQFRELFSFSTKIAKSNTPCFDEMFGLYKNDTEGLHCKCLQGCKEVRFDSRMSMSKWPPSDPTYQTFLTDTYMKDKPAEFNTSFTKAKDNLGDNIARVKVFFDDLSYTFIHQKQLFTTEQLISDVGGQLGLWLGISLLSVAEYFELILTLGRSLLMGLGRRV